MPRAVDLSGRRFGRLMALRLAAGRREPNGKAVRCWLCRCDCGAELSVTAAHLTRRWTRSCGCLNTETRSRLIIERTLRHGASQGERPTPEYITWSSMNGRCTNPNNHKYPRYGGRGIKVCERWRVFENFLADMGAKPSRAHSIERIDNDGHYEPDNCRWATLTEQARNKSNTRWLTHAGETRSLSEWGEKSGIDRRTIRSRLTYGWSVDDALTRPVRPW